MKEIKNFNQGLNVDLARNLYQKDSYIDALNFSLITNYGLSTGVLRNIKGNELFITIPSSSNVVEVTKLLNGTSILTVLGQIFNIDFTSSSWQSTLSSQISSNPTLNAAGIIAKFNADRVVIYSGLDTSFGLITANITASINNTNGSVNTAYLSAVSDTKILGWGTIRDTIFLFTSTEESENPVNSQGQIWKVTYDKFTYTSNISLLYHGRINLSLGHPIPNPGGVLGNYENANIQNLYFTDNFNRPKKINTVDTNLMASSPSSLEDIPDIQFGISTIQKIIYSGNLQLGNYAVSYRLLQDTGGASNFFAPSNFIPIVSANELTNILSYQTDNSTVDVNGDIRRVSKSIKSRIFNIDTSYDRIEPVILYKSTEGVPTITVLPSQPIPQNGVFDFVYTGNETGIPFTLDEFNKENLSFETVKTITSKNNIKFNGNVKYSDFDVNFDARAYRFNRSRIAELTDSQGNIEYTIDGTAPNYNQVLETADAIQDPEVKQAPYSYDNFLYQTDGVTIGGSGLNIKYTFESINPDQSIKNDPYKIQIDNDTSNISRYVPYANTDRSTLDIDLDQDPNTVYDITNTNGSFDNSTSPYHQYQLKGYQRDEVYRFGIIFLSKKGEISYVHWIADIRIPNVFMPSQTVGQPANNRAEYLYPSTSFVGNKWYGNTLGINFTVDISSIKDQISGYKIVRLKREETDKTILGQGILLPTIEDNPNTLVYTIQNDSSIYNVSLYPASDSTSNSFCTFACPEFLYKVHPTFSPVDQIDVIGNLQLSGRGNMRSTGTGNPVISLSQYLKNYRIENAGEAKGFTPLTILNTAILDTAYNAGAINATTLSPSPFDIKNCSPEDSLAGFIQSYGNKRLLIYAPWNNLSNTTWGDTTFNDDVTSGVGSIYLANYRRPNSNQYNGNSYSERSYSEYISTGNCRIIDDINTSYTENVFGGDIQVSLFDYMNGFKNFYHDDSFPGYELETMVGYLAPIECTFPIQLNDNTNNLTFNKGAPYGDFTFGTSPRIPDRIEVKQDFLINFDFFVENDVKLYNPKPFPYISPSKYDVRVHRSQVKINGELTDSWGIFNQDEYIDLNTSVGELNQLMIQDDRLTSFQNNGIAVISVNDRSVVSDAAGAETVLGQSGVLSRYDYISTKIGSKHQFGFIQSNDAIFFLDISTKNIYKLQNSPTSLTVSKGMSSFLSNNLNGLIQTNDNPYLNKGLTGTYNFKHNEAIFTFKDTVSNSSEKANISQIGNTGIVTFDYGRVTVPACITIGSQILVSFNINNSLITEIFIVNTINGSIITATNVNTVISSSSDTQVNIACKGEYSFTLAYNDFIDHFTSFYSHTPSVYVNDFLNIFSPDVTLNNLWIHDGDTAEYCNFYGTVYPSTLKLLINPYPEETKIFQNYELVTESTNQGINVVDDFFDQIRLYTDYQNSDYQDLPIDGTKQIARRVERTWNLSYLFSRTVYTNPSVDIFNPVNISATDPLFPERFRDKVLFVDLIYNNSDNNNFILNSFTTNYVKSSR